MVFVKVIILQDCRGSETGITVKKFTASPDPIECEIELAKVFVNLGYAKYSEAGAKNDVKKPGPTETKIVTPDETKVDSREKKK